MNTPELMVLPFAPDRLEDLARLCGQHMRQVPYTPAVTSELLERKLLRHPLFDPEALLLARERENLVGMIHVGFWPKPESPPAWLGWLGPYWDYGTIVNLVFPPDCPEVGASLIAAAEEHARRRGRRRFAAFSRLGGYLFWKNLLLAGEPLCWDGWPHVQGALLEAGYQRKEPTVLMGMELAQRPARIPGKLELEIRTEKTEGGAPSPFSGFGGRAGTLVSAYRGGEFAGSCGFASFEASVATAKGAPIGAFGMGTVDRFQRMGVGTQVLTHALGLMWDQGIRKVILQTGDDNIPAVKLYEKIGFMAESEAHSHGFQKERP